jgi:large subunit ribosomal protein L23
MALFGKKSAPAKKKASAKAAAPSTSSVFSVHTGGKHANAVLLSPRITEKAAYLSENGAYVFNVSPRATKKEIAAAIRTVYSVTPRLVRVITIPAKTSMSRATGKRGTSAGGKKAIVFLKKDDKIEFI